MLIEVKAKVARVIDDKTRKRTETFLVDKEFFSEAEYLITAHLVAEQNQGIVSCAEIISLKLSPIKEVATQFTGDCSFIATLKDIYLDDNGNEKSLKYKVLLWANSPSEAMNNILLLARQGYDMQIESIKQVDYEYIVNSEQVLGTESNQ